MYRAARYVKRLLWAAGVVYLIGVLWLGRKVLQDRVHGAQSTDHGVQINTESGVGHFQPEGVWPDSDYTRDRVLSQMSLNKTSSGGLIRIAVFGHHVEDYGRKRFLDDQCPVTQCSIVPQEDHDEADVVLLTGRSIPRVRRSSSQQIFVWYNLEAPKSWPSVQNDINWTATYRRDSTINTPYERFTYFPNFTGTLPPPTRNYALGKSKMAAWFVSNCQSSNGRENYATELQKYIRLDKFGACGSLSCDRQSSECFDMLSSDYKFYLAFENANCVDYITEKLYWNALLHDVVPIVLGARPQDYQKVAPPNSYIHVDDFASPRHLANYLAELDRNDTEYNEYFRWKGIGGYINTKFWCRLCGLAHEARRTGVVLTQPDLRGWWAGDGVCVRRRETTGAWASWGNFSNNNSNTDSSNTNKIFI